jgi:hypothetical protein
VALIGRPAPGLHRGSFGPLEVLSRSLSVLSAVPTSAWLAFVLREHRARSGGVDLVFPRTASTPLNKANVRKRV